MKIDERSNSMFNIIGLLNKELKKLNFDLDIRYADVKLSAIENSDDESYTSKITFTNAEGKDKLSKPITMYYNRLNIKDVHAKSLKARHKNIITLQNKEYILYYMSEGYWSIINEEYAKTIVGAEVRNYLVDNTYETTVVKRTEDRYDITITPKSDKDNLLYLPDPIYYIFYKENTILE